MQSLHSWQGRAESGNVVVDAVGTLFGRRQSTSTPMRGGAPESLSRSCARSPEDVKLGLPPSGIEDAADAHTYRVLPGLSHSHSVDKSLILKRARNFSLSQRPSQREARIRAVIRDDDDDDDFVFSARRPQRKSEFEMQTSPELHEGRTDGRGPEMDEDRKRAKQLLMEAHAILKGAHEVARTALHAVQQSVDSVSL